MILLLLCFLFYDGTAVTQTQHFTLRVEYFWKVVDTFEKAVISVNQTHVAPTLRATEGSEVVIEVFNDLFKEVVTVHWHGITVQGNPYSDGVPYVSQCPILPGHSMVYRFTALHHGTFWYHGHVESQREDAFFGPLIIDPLKKPIVYDDERILMISDFYREYGNTQLLMLESAPFRWVGSPQNILVNGEVSPTITVDEGKVYLLRFISAAALSWYNISIPNHTMRIVEVEGDWVKPMDVNSLWINAGERYAVLLNATSPGCYKSNITMLYRAGPSGAFNLFYSSLNCADTTPITGHSTDIFDVNKLESTKTTKLPAPTKNITIYSRQVLDADGGIRWEINDVSWKFPETPMILELYYTKKLSSEEGVFWIKKGDVVDMLFINEDRWDGGQEQHPYHFHGHSIWVLGSGLNTNSERKLNLINPVLRDTFTLPHKGWAMIRFVASNPGVWIFHCMGMVFAVAYEPDSLPDPPADFELCGNLPGPTDHTVLYVVIIALVLAALVVVFVVKARPPRSSSTDETTYLLPERKSM